MQSNDDELLISMSEKIFQKTEKNEKDFKILLASIEQLYRSKRATFETFGGIVADTLGLETAKESKIIESEIKFLNERENEMIINANLTKQ